MTVSRQVPVIGRGHADGLDIFVLVHLAEVGVALALGFSEILKPFLKARLVDVAEGGQFDVLHLLEVAGVLLADEAESDQPDADAVVGSEDAAVGGCGDGRRAEETAARGSR
jgi:hypothetical protein